MNMYYESPLIELPDIRQNKNGEWEVIENSPFDEFLILLDEALRKKRIEQTCFGI